MNEHVSHLRAKGQKGVSACGRQVDEYLLGDSGEDIECGQCRRTGHFKKVVRAEIESLLAGSCRPAIDAAEAFGLDEDDVGEIMTDAGHEMCVTCGWWHEEGDIDVVGGEHVCIDCRGEEVSTE